MPLLHIYLCVFANDSVKKGFSIQKEKDKSRNRTLEQQNHGINGAFKKAGRGYFETGVKITGSPDPRDLSRNLGQIGLIIEEKEHVKTDGRWDRWMDGHDVPLMLSLFAFMQYAKWTVKIPLPLQPVKLQ